MKSQCYKDNIAKYPVTNYCKCDFSNTGNTTCATQGNVAHALQNQDMSDVTPVENLKMCLFRVPTMPKSDISSPNGSVAMQINRAAFLKSAIWPANSELHVGFFKEAFNFIDPASNKSTQIPAPDNVDYRCKWVETIIEKYITPLVNLKFVWDTPLSDPKTNIRIAFMKGAGAWSTLGTQAKTQAQNQPTMNLGWLDTDSSAPFGSDADFPAAAGKGTVVIHEFGHVLGMIHEHSRQDTNFIWNYPTLIKTLGGPPNSWSCDEVCQQMFCPYEQDSYNGSDYDPKSIMHYYFDANFFICPPPNFGQITSLSDTDIKWINSTYSGKDISGYKKSVGGGGSNGWFSHNWPILLIAIITIILLSIIIYIVTR
jgi:hypothetical protein